MREILKTFLSMSVSGSLLILMLLAGRPFLRGRVSRGWQYYIWLVVIARLLLPFAPEVNLMGAFFRQAEQEISRMETVPEESRTGEKSERTVGFGAGEEYVTYEEAKAEAISAADSDGGTERQEPALSRELEVFWLLWPVVAIGLLIRKFTLYQSFVKYVKAGWQEVKDIALLDRLARAEAQLGIKKPVELCVNSLVSSPMLIGFFHPCIVLPDAELPETDFQFIIEHELLHYRRRDMFYKWLVQVTICLHWFNPLVYLMGREINRACELACDEAVIRQLDAGQRRAYGDTLLHAMGAGGRCRNSPAALTLNESAELLRERLSAIINFRKSTKRMRLLAMLLSAVFLAGATGAGAYAGPVVLSDVKGEGASSFRFTQEGYYQPPYLFEIGWNVRENAGESYAGTEFPLMRPLVVSVQNIGEESPATLAEQYYQENSLPQFAAVFAQMTEKEQKAFLDKIYENGQTAFFSAALDRLAAGSALTGELAEKAYADGKISFFSLLADHMDPKTLEGWAARAKEDNRTSFQAVLYDKTGEEQEKQELEKELDARRLEEYRTYGITRMGTAYCYRGEMVKILLDTRPDSSLVTLEQNPQGTVYLKITRDENGEIRSAGYMTEAEAAELLDDMTDDLADEEMDNGANRRRKEELPEKVLAAMDNCTVRTWYVLRAQGKQYLYCNGFGCEYAWEPVRSEDGWHIRIERFRKKDGGYVLLEFPDGAPVVLTCDGERISPEIIEK